jgi:hypothetical protein
LEPKAEALLTEQLRHAIHLLEGQIRTLEARMAHQQAMNHQRLLMLEEQIRDHETRDLKETKALLEVLS